MRDKVMAAYPGGLRSPAIAFDETANSTDSGSGTLGLIAASGCALAIGSGPILSTNESLSIVPQILSLLGAGLAALTLLKGIPRFHISLLAYVTLVVFWGITLLSDPDLWPYYQSLLKVCLFAIACYFAFRSRQHLLILFGVYAATGAITVPLNWHQLQALGASMEVSQLSDKDRFAGTFQNANVASIYGVLLMLSGLIMGFSIKKWWRWPLTLIGLLAGLLICFFSGSRKGMLGVGLLFLIVPWMAAQSGRNGRRSSLKIIFFVIISLALGGLLLSQLPFTDRLLVPFKEGVAAESSSRERFAMLQKAVELWGTSPLLGCGFEGFRRLSGFDTYSHTTLGEVLCNAGLFGLGLLGVFYIVPGIQLWRLIRNGAASGLSQIAIALLGFWAIFILFSFFAVMFDSPCEFVPIYAAICGFLQSNRGRPSFQTFVPGPERGEG